MKSLLDDCDYRAALRNALVSGSAAALASAAMAAQRAGLEGASAAAPMNAVTLSLWPRKALRVQRASVRYTLTGFAIHTCASIFWALGFETLRARRDAERSLRADIARATAVAAAAWCVDYHVVPGRLTPGFEAHLSKRSLIWVYGALAAGFVAAAYVDRRAR
jgi:hypothetical protein